MPVHPIEETALLEIKELAQHPLYQQTCAPDTPAGQSKTSINNALQKGIIAANTGGTAPAAWPSGSQRPWNSFPPASSRSWKPTAAGTKPRQRTKPSGNGGSLPTACTRRS